MKATIKVRGREYWKSAAEMFRAGYCWYRTDRRCAHRRDCRVAGRCCDCWNPAEKPSMRLGALWMHDVRS